MLGVLAVAVVLVVAVVLSLAIGARTLSIAEILAGLGNPQPGSPEAVVRELRVPRTLIGVLVGVALGLSGATVQIVTKNPVADPGILGINAGAAFAVAVTVIAGGAVSVGGGVWHALGVLVAAFVGAMVVSLTVVVLGLRGGRGGDALRVTLVGVAIAAVLTGFTVALGLADPMAFASLQGWLSGSIAGYDVTLPAAAAPIVIAAAAVLLCHSRSLGAISMGSDVAASLGVSVSRVTLTVVLLAALLAATATAVAGPIAFIGLVAPLLARAFSGPRSGLLLVLSGGFGASVVLVADVIGRVALTDGEIPAGIVATFVGGPALILAVTRGRLGGAS